MVYTSVTYVIYHRQFGPSGSNTIVLADSKNCGCKK